MKILVALEHAVSRVEQVLLVLILLTLLVLASLQVILRNMFSEGILWADPFLRHIVMWAGFLGASLATRNSKHISIDLISRFAGPRILTMINVLTSAVASLVCYFLADAGWTFLKSEIDSAEILITIGTLECPAWWFQTIIPFGFGLMSVRFAVRVIEILFQPASGRTELPSQQKGEA